MKRYREKQNSNSVTLQGVTSNENKNVTVHQSNALHNITENLKEKQEKESPSGVVENSVENSPTDFEATKQAILDRLRSMTVDVGAPKALVEDEMAFAEGIIEAQLRKEETNGQETC